MNLMREFEVLKMKEDEVMKDYVDKLMKIVNQVRLLGAELSDARIVEKVLVSIPERFESKILALEESKDLTAMSLQELVNALQALEQRRAIRSEVSSDMRSDSALVARHKGGAGSGTKKTEVEKKERDKKSGDGKRQKAKFLLM